MTERTGAQEVVGTGILRSAGMAACMRECFCSPLLPSPGNHGTGHFCLAVTVFSCGEMALCACCAMLCHAVPCCAMLSPAVPCCALLCPAEPCCAMLCHGKEMPKPQLKTVSCTVRRGHACSVRYTRSHTVLLKSPAESRPPDKKLCVHMQR